MSNIITASGGVALTVTSVPLGGYASVFNYGDSYKLVGQSIQRSLYPEMSTAFPRRGAGYAIAGTSTQPSAYAICYGNGMFIDAGASSQFSISADGLVWTTRTHPISAVYSVAYGNGLWVMAGGGGSSPQICTSPDAINWTTRTVTSAALVGCVIWAADKGLFVGVCGSTGTSSATAITSPDGITWTNRTLPASSQWSAIAYGNGTFVALAGRVTSLSTAVFATSTDGINWVSRSVPANNYADITYGNGLFVVVNTNGATVLTSPDGITWTSRASLVSMASIEFANGLFVGVAINGASWATSADGSIWQTRIGSTSTAANTVDITFGAGTFVAVTTSNSGTLVMYAENSTDSDWMYISGTAGQYVRVK